MRQGKFHCLLKVTGNIIDYTTANEQLMNF